MVRAAVDSFGGLHCAVNAAAIELEHERLADLDEATFDRIIAVNLKSIFLCMKFEIGQMLAQGSGGAIVNIASTNSFRPQPHQSAYTASKHGVLGLTRNAAIDYAVDEIRINAICPGAIDTPMLRNAIDRRGRDPQEVANRLTLAGRFGTVDEIAQAALWLCSDESSFTMGHALAVDGGYLAR
jgi:glucose 1-dehydrogenase